MAKVYNRWAKKLQAKSRECKVEEGGHGTFRVQSPSGKEYYVWFGGDSKLRCGCDWHDWHPNSQLDCSHTLAVRNYLENVQKGRSLSFWKDEEEVQKQHRPGFQCGERLWATSRV